MAKILVAGDTHANPAHWRFLCEEAVSEGCDRILQVGDFGWFPHVEWGQRFIGFVRQSLEDYGLVGYFIDGNHDKHIDLWRQGEDRPRTDDGMVRVTKGLYYIPRGTRWTWNGGPVSFLALGGAYSVDKKYRVEGFSWWPEEDIRREDTERCFDAIEKSGTVSVMITHDAPIECATITKLCWDNGWKDDPLSLANRRAVQAVMEAARPKVLIHGHHHHRYDEVLRYDSSATKVIGLGCDSDRRDSWVSLDLEDPGWVP